MSKSDCKNWRVSRLAIFLLLGVGLVVWIPARLSATPLKQVKIAVRAHSGVEAAKEKWSPTAAYLSQMIEGYHFTMIPMVGFDEMETAVEQQEVDFVLTNPSAYINLRELFGITKIVTLINNVGGRAEKQFGEVIFAQAERADIRDFSDIKGKTMIGVHEKAFCGWWMVLGELKKHGISPNKDCRQVLFADQQEAVVFAVKEGRADVGAVRAGIMERLAEKGEISLDDFIIIGRKTDDFPYLHSTQLYPEWPLSKAAHTSDSLTRKVAVALLTMPEKHPAALKGGYAGWLPPLHYVDVINLMQDLRVGPYKHFGKVTYSDATKKLGHWLLLFIVFAGGFVLAIMYKKRKQEIITSELQLEKDNFLNILNSMTDGVYIIDNQFNVKFINDVLKKEFGEPHGQKCFVYFYDRKEPCPWCHNSEVFKGKTVRWVGHSSRNQRDYDLIDSPLLNPDGSISKLEISRDITEIKQAQEKLEQSENKFRSMMEAMSDPVYICSDDYRVEYMNPAMIKRTGRDFTGESCYQALHDFDHPCSWCKDTEDRGKCYESDIVSPKDNHSFHSSHSPVINEDGSVSKMTIFRDTTEFKKVEAQLLQSQKMESIGNLAGGVAHDFNNILTVIYGFSEMALNNLEEGSPVWKYVQEIQKSGERAANLTRQLLAFSRKQVIMPKALNINSLINDMRKMLSRLISEDIRLETELNEQVGFIYADPGQVEQIIINLVVNARDAVKHQPKSAKKIIQISTSRVFLDDAFVATHLGSSSGWHIQLQVEDSGCGISKEVLPHVFEPFYTTKGEGEGTGMGLATVYGIVKQNRGSIYVYSEPGQGATFKICWPIMEGEIATAADPELQPAAGGAEVILLAEDNQQIREISSLHLREAGYTVIDAADGLEALEKAAQYQGSIDLLFTDVVMPVMGAKELSEKIRYDYPDITILFTSGYTDNGIHQEILALGKDCFINKPYSIQDVMARIRRLLDDKES